MVVSVIPQETCVLPKVRSLSRIPLEQPEILTYDSVKDLHWEIIPPTFDYNVVTTYVANLFRFWYPYKIYYNQNN